MKRFKYLTLAALVAFAACDEGEETITPPLVTGSITGVVSIEGAGIAGITVTLSSGATATTDASGAFTFSGVEAGAYTVSISGFPADATFSSTALAATITTAGQVVSLNFSGEYVRTSAIIGSVAAGGLGIPNVSVSIGASQTLTDDNGQFAFSGLRAGSYTVDISGFDPNMYSFANTSTEVTVGVGESKVVSFSGTLVATATIKGRLYIDENDTNQTFDGEALEDNLTVAGVRIGLEHPVGDTLWTETDEMGMYEFTDLEVGNYKVIVDADDEDIPGNVVYGEASHSKVRVVGAAGETLIADFGFVITQQAIQVFGFLGVDETNPGVRPIEGWTINLYDTEENAAEGGTTGLLDSEDTDAGGGVTFRFDRDDDISPNVDISDDIVFAQVDGPPGAGYAMSGEMILEIRYEAKDSLVMANDTLDALFGMTTVAVKAAEIDGDELEDWRVFIRANDTAHATTGPKLTDDDGYAYFDIDLGYIEELDGGGDEWPQTLYFTLGTAQAEANGHAWTQTPMPDYGSSKGRFLQVVWDGTAGPEDTIMAGTEEVTYLDVDFDVIVHRERDDSTGVTPTFTALDDFAGVHLIEVTLYEIEADGDTVMVPVGPGIAANPANPDGDTGLVEYNNLDPTKTWFVSATSTDENLFVLDETSVTANLDGSDQEFTGEDLEGGAGPSTFAIKSNNNKISGTVLTRYGTWPAEGVIVTASPDGNIQGTPMVTDTTDAVGVYSFSDLVEGPYTVMVDADGNPFEFLNTLETEASGSADNETPDSGIRDLQGYAVMQTANFEAYATDVAIVGVVVNDRDEDENVVDPGEALEGAVFELYMDDDGGVGRDTLIGTATSDINGVYMFENLREGQYMVRWVAGTPDASVEVLKALSQDSLIILATADPAGNGTDSPEPLPRWDYATSDGVDGNDEPTHFMFLVKNTVVTGRVLDAGVAVPGMTVSLRRCDDSTANGGDGNTLFNDSGPQPVTISTRCISYLGTTQNRTTDSDGRFTFADLIEGVYEVTPAPSTVGGYTDSDPAQALFLTVGNGDVEEFDFDVGND